MPAELNNIVSITITTTPAPLQEAGFGVPMILGVDQGGVLGSAIAASYTTLADMVSAGWSTTSPEYRAAAKMLAQDVSPSTFIIGRRATKPTMQWKITPTAVNNGVYRMTFGDQSISFTADGTATVTEIIAGLKAAIDALSLAVTVSDQTTYMKILANTAGAWFECSVADPTLLTVEQAHADPGVATDLDAINTANSSWFALVSVFASTAEVAAIAAWAETAKKLYLADSQHTAIELTGTGDIASTLKTSAYKFTAVFYHRDNGAFLAAGVAGKCLPLDPGSETWAFKTIASVAAVAMTAGQEGFAEGKNANDYTTRAGRNITFKGTVASGDYIDSIRAREWFKSRLQERVFDILSANSKVPFTDAGAALVQAECLAQIKEGVRVGYIAPSPVPTVTVPAVSSVDSTNKGLRNLPNVQFTFTEAGAIHKTTVNGIISV